MLAQHLFPSQTDASPPTGSCKALCSPAWWPWWLWHKTHDDLDNCVVDDDDGGQDESVVVKYRLDVVWFLHQLWPADPLHHKRHRRLISQIAYYQHQPPMSPYKPYTMIYHVYSIYLIYHIFTCSWAQACHIRRMEAEELSTLLTWLGLYSLKSCSPPDIFQKSKKCVMSRKWTKEVWSKDE